MPTQLYCTKCGLEAALDQGEIQPPCSSCGSRKFATLEELDWRFRLTQNDKLFLKSLKIAID